MMRMHPNQPEITRRYLERKKSQGQRRVTVVVPEDRVEELKEIARKMREEDRNG